MIHPMKKIIWSLMICMLSIWRLRHFQSVLIVFIIDKLQNYLFSVYDNSIFMLGIIFSRRYSN